MEANYLFLIYIVYFFGSIPFAYILPKIFGLGDIRNLGSGNVGATNVLRAGNKLLAIIVLAFDIDKRKVGLPLNKAILQRPNCLRIPSVFFS